jgi:hypothetical protein
VRNSPAVGRERFVEGSCRWRNEKSRCSYFGVAQSPKALSAGQCEFTTPGELVKKKNSAETTRTVNE